MTQVNIRDLFERISVHATNASELFSEGRLMEAESALQQIGLLTKEVSRELKGRAWLIQGIDYWTGPNDPCYLFFVIEGSFVDATRWGENRFGLDLDSVRPATEEEINCYGIETRITNNMV
jgi:hypothetical protein